MERVFIGVTRAEATRKADEWWKGQKGLRQTLRTEVAVGGKGPDAQLDRWAITIREFCYRLNVTELFVSSGTDQGIVGFDRRSSAVWYLFSSFSSTLVLRKQHAQSIRDPTFATQAAAAKCQPKSSCRRVRL